MDLTTLGDGKITLCVIGADQAGNVQSTAKATKATWVKDTTPPVATITGAPTGNSKLTKIANIKIGSAGGDAVSYRYKIFGGAASSCGDGKAYSEPTPIATPLSSDLNYFRDGAITLCVVGIDALGNVQEFTKATKATWVKDTIPPVATITGAPTGRSKKNHINDIKIGPVGDVVSYQYKIHRGPDFKCSDSLPYSAVTSVKTPISLDLSELGDGVITLCVISKDEAGNEQTKLNASQVSWTKDTIPPVATITGAPTGNSNLTNVSNIKIGSARGDAVSYQFKVGSDASLNCSDATPYSKATPVAKSLSLNLTKIPDGRILLCVIGTDAEGNTQDMKDATKVLWLKDTKVKPASAPPK